MKSFLFTLAIFFSLTLATQEVYAQAQVQSCAVVENEVDFNTCCTGANGANYFANQDACTAYQQTIVTGGGGSLPAGTLGSGGAPNTNPQNTDTTTGAASGSFGSSSSSAELRVCTDIKFTSLIDILIWLKCIIGRAIIPLIMSAAFVFFLWGMLQYIRNANDVAKREESKKFIIYGIVGLTVMVAVWGIVRIVTNTFGFGNTVPQLQTDCLTTNPNNPCKK